MTTATILISSIVFLAEARLVVVSLTVYMKLFTQVSFSIPMEWSLFVRYNVWAALWLLNKFFNTCHTFVGSKRFPIVGIKLSLIIKIVRTLSFLDHSKVTSFVCCTSTIVACYATASSCTLATSLIAPSSRATTCAWPMGRTSIIVTMANSTRQTNSHSHFCLNSWWTLTF